MRSLIVTGDDFGLTVPVNEAIEIAHRRGILTTASLMVSAPATEDAVRRALRCPSLKVGLHLVLIEGTSVLSHSSIPDLVNLQGEFSSHLLRTGIKFFFHPRIRTQLEAEIRAQFERFRLTGLSLDHVNAHNHFHLHPTILNLIIQIGCAYGMKAIRVPYEPFLVSWLSARQGFLPRLGAWLGLAPWMGMLRIRLRLAGIRSNDFVFGLYDSGHMTKQRVLDLLLRLPEGVTEMYFHPSTQTCPELQLTMEDYEHVGEFETLMSSTIQQTIAAGEIRSGTFSDL